MNAVRLALTIAVLCGCHVSVETHGVHGLWTSPNPRRNTPDGALSEANNVVFRRPGMAEPRPGFELGTAISDASAPTELRGLIAFDGLLLSITDGETFWPPSTVVTGSGATLQWDTDRGNVRGVEARQNLYLTTTDAMRVLNSSTDATAPQAGIERVTITANLNGSAATNIAAESAVAYVAVTRRRDANDLVVRSAPSGRVSCSHTSMSAVSGSVTIRVHANGALAAGDTVEIYRTRTVPNTVPPPREYYLALEHEIVAADLSAGFVTLDDITEETSLGLTLYTNPSREGIERANVRPPSAKDIALFQGSMFAANLTYPPAIELKWSTSGNLTAIADGIGYRNTTGTRTNASADITGLADTTGLEVGMLLDQDTNWGGTENVRITDINGSDVTMSETWSGSTDGAPAAVRFYDSVRVKSASEDLYYYAYLHIAVVDGIIGNTLLGPAFRATASTSSEFTAYAIGTAVSFTGVTPDFLARHSIAVEGLQPDSESFEVFATHGDEYEPPLPTPDQANGEPSVQDVLINGIAWSKDEKPEHFLLGGRRLVGNQNSPVLRVIPTRDAVWVLKGRGDGIYRLSGVSERTGWRLDLHDSTTYLLHPNLAVAYGDVVYAWTNNGPMRLGDAGVQPIGVEIENLTRSLETLLDHDQDNYAFASANLKDGELIFGLPDVTKLDSSAVPAQVFVFNVERGRWSQWFSGDSLHSCSVYNPTDRMLAFGNLGGTDPRVERPPGDSFANADREIATNITGVASNVISCDSVPSYITAGALISQSGNVAIVISKSGTDLTVNDATGFSAAAATLYEHMTSRLAWLPKTGGSSSTVKRFDSVSLEWDDVFGLYTWDVELSGQPGSTALTRTPTRSWARSSARDETRAHTDRTVAKVHQLYVAVEVAQADARWRLSGMSAWSNVISRRVSR